MPSTQESQSKKPLSIVLKPNIRLPVLVYLVGIAILPLPFHPWATLCVCGLAVFLLAQAYLLRLELTDNDFVIWRVDQELRRFPFENWLAWRIFLPGLPGILFFREVRSPHLLPILFDPLTLLEQLRLRVGELEVPKMTDQDDSLN